MQTDILIGASDGYNWTQLKNWVISSKLCGFKGRRVVLAYRMDEETQKKLMEHGIEIYKINTDIYGREINHDARVNVGAAHTVSHEIRYFHTWQLLSQMNEKDIRFVILTDIRDVIFQTDPSPFLEDKLQNNYQLIAPSEGISYKFESWNAKNLFEGYGPYVYETLKNNSTYNCGTIAGKFEYFKNFVLTMWSMTCGKYTYPADQCSFGVLVHTLEKDRVLPLDHDSGWACQCGTVADPIKIEQFKPHLIAPLPIMQSDGFVYTSTGIKYVMVHQYERNPLWLSIINKIYGE